jgi:glyoxylate reductase
MTQAQLAEAMQTADVLVPTVTDHIDAAVLARPVNSSPDRQFGNGVDNIDVAAPSSAASP